MGYTAAALAFALRELPVPVILVGAQRSSDRPSSDAALNLISAVAAAARAPIAEVMVAMHESLSDRSVVLHRGTRIRKNHTSRRDAFQTVDALPYGRVRNGSDVELFAHEYSKRTNKADVRLMPQFSDKAALLRFYPSFDPSLIDILIEKGYEGIVLEGSGLGHVNESSFPSLERAREEGIPVFMTSQCIWGRTNLRVYDTGRDLLCLGIVPLENMLSETAIVKLMWTLGNYDNEAEVVEAMKRNIAGETQERSLNLDHGGPSA
jgi:glutamyl-tRNA(Gln) amidotransferase subunit D